MKVEVINIDIDVDKIVGPFSNDDFRKALAADIKERMNKYVPMETGSLQREVTILPGKIIYTSDYAHYMFEGKLYVNPDTGGCYIQKDGKKVATDIDLNYNLEHNSLATSHWDKAMMEADRDEVIARVKSLYEEYK